MKNKQRMIQGWVMAILVTVLGVCRAADSATDPVTNVAPGTVSTVDVYGVKLELVWIPPGKFMMGSPDSEQGRVGNEGPQHEVTISQGFWMSKYEITQEQWEKMPPGANPSAVKNPRNPVEMVTWEDCNRFINELNSRVKGTNYHMQYRLPTEAEWEYACRAGTATAFHCGDSLDANQADFDGNFPGGKSAKGEYRQRPIDVGRFKPNAWGLHDMHGNVSEWCQDWGYGVYGHGPVTDPAGPEIGAVRVVRGGAWHNPASFCRSAFRNYNSATTRTAFMGLRVVLINQNRSQ